MSIYTPEQEALITALQEEVQTLHSAVMGIKARRAWLRQAAQLYANVPTMLLDIEKDIAALDAAFTPANNKLLDATKRLNQALNQTKI